MVCIFRLISDHYIWAEKALPRLTPAFVLRKGRRLEIPHDGHAPNAEVLGNRAIRPPLAVQAPDLCIGREAPRPVLRRPCLGLRRRCTQGDRDGGLAIGLGDGGAAPCVAHRLERGPMGAEHLVEGFGEVLQGMETVGDLRGLRRARTGTIAIGSEAISGYTQILCVPHADYLTHKAIPHSETA
jgi:hypothetical protein